MKKYLDSLNGYKTYISAGVGALIVFARLLDLISDEQFQLLATLAGFTGLSALRLGMKK